MKYILVELAVPAVYPIAPKAVPPYAPINCPPLLNGAASTHTAVDPTPNSTSS